MKEKSEEILRKRAMKQMASFGVEEVQIGEKKYKANVEDEFLKESNAIENVRDDQSFRDAQQAWKYLKRQKILTRDVVSTTHKILMVHQNLDEKYKGEFRDCAVFIGGRRAMNWMQIPARLREWMAAMNMSMQNEKNKSPLERRARGLHVEYEKIHPFIDGNGRTGRMFMNWHRLYIGLPILVIHEGKEQMDYYKWFQ